MMNQKIFALLIILFSCTDEQSVSKKIYTSIQGDWLAHNSSSPFFLSIKDSLIGYDYYENFKIFHTKKDIINIVNSKSNLVFSKITPKYLRYIDKNSGKEIPAYISSKIFRDEMITLRRIEARFRTQYGGGFINVGKFDFGIVFDDRRNCFIKIDNTVQSQFINPFLKKRKNGLYKGKFSESDFVFYQDKLRNIPFDSLKENYISNQFAGGGDATIILLEIKYSYLNSTEIMTKKIIAKGFYGIPSYLGVFVNYLHKINTFIEFEQDSTLVPSFNLYSDKFNNHQEIFKKFHN